MIRVRTQSPTCLCLERSERNGKNYEKEIMQYHLLMQPCFNYVVCMWKERTGKSH